MDGGGMGEDPEEVCTDGSPTRLVAAEARVSRD